MIRLSGTIIRENIRQTTLSAAPRRKRNVSGWHTAILFAAAVYFLIRGLL